MRKKAVPLLGLGLLIFTAVWLQVWLPAPAFGAGATTAVHVVRYGEDGSTILDEKDMDYLWMEENLPVFGDGMTHYFHQGPVFEGDLWDPSEVSNLKDKGAVKGTAVKDLCEQVGGMQPQDEVMLVSVDGWHTHFGYANIYTPVKYQGTIALCWFNGEDADEGERYGVGYPANNAYRSALQMVFMTDIPNADGKLVFGNTDMRKALPQEEYQHFFEGQYPSTNGLSGKWIREVAIYSGGVPDQVVLTPAEDSESADPARDNIWVPALMGLGGVLLVGWYIYARRKIG